MTQDQKLLSIRPQLGVEPSDDTAMAHFQVQTLRPVLKMQHDLLISIFRAYLKEIKLDLEKHSPQKQKEIIEKALTTQPALKFTLLGTVMGLFTKEEQGFYQENKQEINKRLLRFIAKRIFEGLNVPILS